MTFGLRIRKPVTGEIMLDLTDRVTRLLGNTIINSNGTITTGGWLSRAQAAPGRARAAASAASNTAIGTLFTTARP